MGDVYNSVLVEGNTSFGDTPEGIASQWNYSQWYASKRNNSLYYMDTDSLWLPVFPRVWDNDSAPVLAIVGTAFMMVLSMQIWSNTFKKSDAKAVFFLWSGLLFTGSICALINAGPFAGYSKSAIPQLRFCPPNLNDTLPLNSGSANDFDACQHAMDPCFWNRTAGGSVFLIVVSVFVLWSAMASLVIFISNIISRPRNGLKSRAHVLMARILGCIQPSTRYCERILKPIIIVKGNVLSAECVRPIFPTQCGAWLLVLGIISKWLWKFMWEGFETWARFNGPAGLLLFVIWIEW